MFGAIRITMGFFASIVILLSIEAFRISLFEYEVMRRFLPEKDTANSPALYHTTSVPPTRLQNIRLVFMGDSVTRYQYLSLAYFLRYGRWYDTDVDPHVNNLMSAHSFHHPFHPLEDWNEFFLQSNRLLYPMEVCDCLRGESSRTGLLLERRYFYDARYNNMLVYINMNGNETYDSRGGYYGRLRPEQIFGPEFSQQVGIIPGIHDHAGSVPDVNPISRLEWDYSTWGEVIRYHIGALNFTHRSAEAPDPDAPATPPHVLLNFGLHPNNFHELPVVRDVADALQEIQVSSATWRTTTFDKEYVQVFQQHMLEPLPPPSIQLYNPSLVSDTLMCQALEKCLNVSWTLELRTKNYYVDDLHFLEPIYRIFNEEYLAQIGLLPEGYERYHRYNLVKALSEKKD